MNGLKVNIKTVNVQGFIYWADRLFPTKCGSLVIDFPIYWNDWLALQKNLVALELDRAPFIL